MLIDTHCHIQSDSYDNVDEVITNSNNEGIELLIITGYDRVTNEESIALAKKYRNIYAVVGYGPTIVKDITNEDLILLEEQIKNEKVIAIGEIGLDYYWYKDEKENQINLFREQIKLAKKYNKPIIVHCREAINDIYNILKQENVNQIGGIMHCYSSSIEMAHKLIKLGMLFGVGGVITFKNTKLGSVIEQLPIEYIVLETDSPYLTPEPYRGQKNEPKYIGLVAEKIALIKGMTYEEVVARTGDNVLRLFDLKNKL